MLFNTAYYHVPPKEIDQAINWLQSVVEDCELKINELERLKKEDQRQARHINRMNEIADMFDDPDWQTIDYDNQVRIIQQRLGCEWPRAHAVHDLLRKRWKMRALDKRNKKIWEMHSLGKSPAVIARENGVTRQTVYNVIKKMNGQRLK